MAAVAMLSGLSLTLKNKSQRSDSNRQPLVYKTRALPLSYVGIHPWVVKLGCVR